MILDVATVKVQSADLGEIEFRISGGSSSKMGEGSDSTIYNSSKVLHEFEGTPHGPMRNLICLQDLKGGQKWICEPRQQTWRVRTSLPFLWHL